MKKKVLALILAGVCAFGLVGCGKEEKKKEVNVDITEVHNSVKEAYGETYYPNQTYDTNTIEQMFGVKEDLYEKAIAEGPMMSFSVDTFVAIKAKSGKGSEVKKALTDYREKLVNDSMQYPTNKVKIQASQVVSYDDYVFFILLGDIPMEVEEQGDEAILEAAKSENQKAIDAIDKFFK